MPPFPCQPKDDDDHDANALRNARWDRWDGKLPTESSPFPVTDFVCRVEWQKRGFPHAHLLLWADLALPKKAGRAAKPKPEAVEERAHPQARDPILPVSRRELDLIMSGKATALIRPKNVFRASERVFWLAARTTGGRGEIEAVVHLQDAEQIITDQQWRDLQSEHGFLQPERLHKQTWFLKVLLCQAMVAKVPYVIVKGAIGDHVYRPYPADKQDNKDAKVQCCEAIVPATPDTTFSDDVL